MAQREKENRRSPLAARGGTAEILTTDGENINRDVAENGHSLKACRLKIGLMGDLGMAKRQGE